jgi:hypothetical protein
VLAYPPISIEGQEEGEVRTIPLKARAAMCEITGCQRPAQFLVKYKRGVLRAICEKHANLIARRYSEHSPDSK